MALALVTPWAVSLADGILCHSPAQSHAVARNSSCPDQTRWLNAVSRLWLEEIAADGRKGCKVGTSWVKGGCKVVKPIVFMNVGANKGFAVSSMLQHFSSAPAFTNMDWLNEVAEYMKYTFGVKLEKKDKESSFLNDYCGACRSCEERPTPVANLTSAVELDVHAFELAQSNVKWLRWAFAKFGVRASLVRAAATNQSGRVKVPVMEGIEDFGDEKGAVRTEHASMSNHGRNHDCPLCRPVRCYEEGKCWQYLNGLPLDDYLQQESLRRVHLVSIDTEGHDAFVLEGLRGSLSRGVVDVVEFEFNSVLGSWNSRSSTHRTLRETLSTLESFRYGCFWQDSAGCISPASGTCWKNGFERVGWSNLVCGRGTSAPFSGGGKKGGARGGGVGEGTGETPLAALWELSNACYSEFGTPSESAKDPWGGRG